MLINRIICILTIIGTGIFASYYGGNISYALFYLSLLIPITSFIYTFYVYVRFKLLQSLENHLVIKGDWNPYSFIIANEDFISFSNIRVRFLSDKSTIEAAGQRVEYSLLPGENDRLETRIKCNYRGEYYVGVHSIEVTDFLYLFTLTYPINTKIKAVVLPRVVPLEELMITPLQIDVKNPYQYSNTIEEELDTEVRRYIPGDHKKRIHWKASAKKQELLSRQYLHKPKASIVLFMDLLEIKDDDLQVTIFEDKIIECVLAIANHYADRRVATQIVYDMGGKTTVNILSKSDFDVFYNSCQYISFSAKNPIGHLIQEGIGQGDEGIFYMVVTHYLTKEFYLVALKAVSSGKHLSVLFISDDISDNTKEIMVDLKNTGVQVHQIMSQDEIEDVL